MFCVFEKKTGFSDLDTSEASYRTTSITAGVILVDKLDIMFVNESSTDVNNAKLYGVIIH